MSFRFLTKSSKMTPITCPCEVHGCSRALSTQISTMATPSVSSTDEVQRSAPLNATNASLNMKRRIRSRPVNYNVWTMCEQPGSTKSVTSQLLRTYKSGKDAVADVQKWLDEEDRKHGEGVQLLRFEDDEYRRLLGKYCRKIYTVVMEDGFWKKSNVAWTEAVPQ